ncbi:TonB-dependent receptor [Sphingomonas sp. SUN039]|uniref:TonB-dependent receptor n=1 Tax=Sphingomonas sp. SUN039 TaxID=2937787 RepID=UPI0021643AD8|nr:TonB-dependent receptor [Sphingomonas sp. SUN039]UVO55714.1 TonB-dependent receptor [Sphingomonas sp. SUN039]
MSAPLRAQDDIVVTGRGLADPAGDAAYSVITVERARLTGTASGRLEDALKDVAGLQQFRRSDARSANPTSQGATLRGLGGNAASRALVLLDGVPQGDPFAGYLNWPLYSPERLGRVRVTRGGGSGAGGSGALAGTIELESVATGDAPGLAGSVAGGSFGAVESRVLASGRLGSGFALVSGGYARGDGFVPVVTPGTADRGGRYEQYNFAARAVIPVGASELQANVDAFDDARTRGSDFSANRTTGADASLRLVGRQFVALGYLQLRRFTSQFASVDAGRTTATQTLDQYNTPATGVGLKVEARPQIGSTELRLGGEWRRTSGETNEAFSYVSGSPTRLRVAGGASDIVGGFAEATRVAGPLTLTGGGRVDYWSLTGGFLTERRLDGTVVTDNHFADRTGWAATGRAGAAYAISPTLTVSVAGYVGWRLPTLNELYRPFRVGAEVTNANAALRPERSRGIELAARWRPGGGAAITVTAFDVMLDDAIANVTLSGTTRQRQNLDALQSRGIEVDATFARGDWRLALSAAYADVVLQGAGASASLTGLRPASVAPFQSSATFGWRGLSATARYVSAQFDDDLNTRRLAPALTVDAVADLPLGRGAIVQLRGENLFDTRVEAAVSASGVVERASPRTIWLGIRFER